MTYIPDDKTNEILEKATLENVLNEYHTFKPSGASKVDDCPKCGGKDKFSYAPKKNTAGCFVCGEHVNSAVNYLQKFQNRTFPEALTELAGLESIIIKEKPIKKVSPIKDSIKNLPKKNPTKKPKPQTPKFKGSFCDRMLAESGLEITDITSTVQVDEDTTKQIPSYQSGSVDQRFKIIPGDDVIIRYYDLENKPMRYYKVDSRGKATDKSEEFYRVRFQMPAAHPDRDGNPVKYKSPYGSDSKVYLPQIIRTKYQNGSKIKTLYIQEGEKKADKACKHNMFSVGIMGIHNIANPKTKSLPREFEQIIRVCQVENVVFVLDADWKDISKNIGPTKPADSRPYSFYSAVSKFKDYFYAFTNNQIYLNIYFGHVKENAANNKGVDDLLNDTMKGIEDQLADKCEKALIDPKGNADYIQLYKITSLSDHKLKEMWHIESAESFIKHHKESLKELTVFQVGRIQWKFNDKGEPEMAQPIEEHEKYWMYQYKENSEGEKEVKSVKFDYVNCLTFLKNRGFGRLSMPGNNFMFIQQSNTIVKEVNKSYIRDFIMEFTYALGIKKYKDVLNMLIAGGSRYFSEDVLGNLTFIEPNFHESNRGIQFLYFQEMYWKITKAGIEESALPNLPGHVWENKIRSIAPKKTEDLFKEVRTVNSKDTKDNPKLKPFMNEWIIEFSATGMDCDFLQFLLNASSFYHNNHTKDIADYTPAEMFETTRHLMNKLTTIGFLLHSYRDPAVLKAVICMDGKMSEVGSSNGRSGKSLVGEFCRWLINTVYIGGKKKDLTDDSFIWEEVDERTELVFIDDVRANFDFERFFPEITGDFQINAKGIKKYSLPRSKSPKILITTNHTIKGLGSSFKDRQIEIAFSDWYSDSHKPINDFDTYFFDDWSNEQRNLAYNLAATCLSLYFKHGIVSAPTEKLEQRKLRQEIGEDFMLWADSIFSNPENINTDISRLSLFNGESPANSKKDVTGNGYLRENKNMQRYTTPTKFKNQMKFYCKFKGWDFNPKQNGGDIKTNGVEYFCIVPTDEEIDRINENASVKFP